MSISVVPEMSVKDLEKVLKHLPKPTVAEVALYGGFDYSSISEQANKLIPGIDITDGGGLIFRLRDPTNDKIIDIYKRSTGQKEAESGQMTVSIIGSAGAKETRKARPAIPLRIDLHKVEWYLGNRVEIELTPWEVNVKYSGKEPSYITQLRHELSGSKVRFGIEANK